MRYNMEDRIMKTIINSIKRIAAKIAAAIEYSNWAQTQFMISEARRGHWAAFCGACSYVPAMAAV